MKDICKTMDPVSNDALLLCDAGNGDASAIQRTLQLKQELTDLLTVAGDIENCMPIFAIVPAREIDSKMDRTRMGAEIGGDM